jgi:hypothetical protein
MPFWAIECTLISAVAKMKNVVIPECIRIGVTSGV